MSRKTIVTLFIAVSSILFIPAANATDTLKASGNCTAPSGWFANMPIGLPTEVGNRSF